MTVQCSGDFLVQEIVVWWDAFRVGWVHFGPPFSIEKIFVCSHSTTSFILFQEHCHWCITGSVQVTLFSDTEAPNLENCSKFTL